jgi:spermidine synthase
MGCTLPLLTAWLVARRRNVGSSVAHLYFVNTAGSALAALAAAAFMMGALGESRSVFVAASLNLLVALFVLLQSRKLEIGV